MARRKSYAFDPEKVGSRVYTLLISLGAILNDVIRGKIIHVAKMASKDESSVDIILQCVHIKRNVFTLYQEEYFLYTMSLWVCYRHFKAFLQRCSWIDESGANESLYKCKKKMRIKVLA